jgi:uncharacterized protein YegP (UPF0339 family)
MARTQIELSPLLPLFEEIQRAEILVPSFQRGFIWKRRQILELLDSVYKGYPIGQFMFFASDEELFNSKPLGEKDRSANGLRFPIKKYIIDGYQRLMTLYNCLYVSSDNKPSIFSVGFDFDSMTFIPLSKGRVMTLSQINLSLLFDTRRYFQDTAFQTALAENVIDLAEVNSLYSAFITYEVPVAILQDMSTDDILETFERLNFRGQRLSRSEVEKARRQKAPHDALAGRGKFQLEKTTSGGFFFHLVAPNGLIILSSEMYVTEAAARSGIESVRLNALNPQRFSRQVSSAGHPYFVLKASNGQIIGKSEMFVSANVMENTISNVIELAPEATISQ